LGLPCLLLVEDDAMVRETIALMLEGAYDVLPASSAATALSHLKEAERMLIQCMLLDCLLPDGKLPALLAEADRRAIPVVLISGDPSQALWLPSPRRFLAKPFSRENLLAAIRAETG
jgi:two-component system cell cycle response regulator CtrA